MISSAGHRWLRGHIVWGVLALLTISPLLLSVARLQADDATTTNANQAPTGDESDAAALEIVNAGTSEEAPTPDGSPDPAASADAAPTEFTDIPWELRPYRVQISIAYGNESSLNVRFRSRLQAELTARMAGVVGPYWQFEVTTNDSLLPATDRALERQGDDPLKHRFEQSDFDKVIWLSLVDEQTLMLAGWEWDQSSQSRSPMLQRQVLDRRLVTDVTCDLLFDLFRPLARIDATEEGIAEIRARGGELMGPTSVGVLLQPDDLLTPHYRYLSREGDVRNVQAVPWTYLRVQDLARSRATCAIETAFTTALTGNRRRVELMAIRARPVYDKTELRLAPRTNPNLPLVGVRARVYDQLPTEADPDPPVAEFMTNRDGIMTVPTNFDRPLRRLLVHSGGAVLASLPLVTGLERHVTLEVPDDTPRLEVEGNLAIIQGELIDLVSRRSVMLARALALARSENWDESDALMQAVDALSSDSTFKSKIIAVQVPGVEKAQANRDTSAEKRINKMAKDLEELVDRYLVPTPVRDVKAEIKELRAISKPR